jgi:hypothetical protein
MNLRSSQDGAVNTLLIPLILSILLFFGALGFGLWAYSSREDYRKNVNKKIDEAVEVAVQRAETRKESEFIKREKRPLTTYKGPQSLGSMTVKYPKTWSIYIDETNTGELAAYAHPQFVPANSGRDLPAYALSVEVADKTYDETVSDYDSFVEKGEAKARPYKLPKRPDIVGLRIDGSVSRDHKGAAVIVPLRDKAIVISTLSTQFVGDFDSIILKNFNFIP